MKIEKQILVMVILLGLRGITWAQDTATQPSTDSAQQTTAPSPAFGQEPVAPTVSQAPPLTGLDEAVLEPNISARSFLAPSFRVTEYGSTNATNSLSGTRSWTGITHLQGALDLQRLWSRYQTALDYVGGVTIYDNYSVTPSQVHHLYFDQRLLWRRGVLQIRDSASYLPEGSFGFGSFGGAGGAVGGGGLGGGLGGGGLGGGIGGRGSGFGGSTFGSAGNIPRLTNTAIVDLQETLTPRSAITLAGGYGILHFTQATDTFIDNHQVTAQAGYNYTVSRRSTLAAMYGYQTFTFPQQGGGSFQTHVVHALYGYQLSGRMSLLLGGGPQFIHYANPTLGSADKISGSGRITLRYRFSQRASAGLNYDHFTSGGSGFFAGAETDLVRVTMNRQMGRLWTLYGDLGYTHNHRLQQSTKGADAASYNSGYGGIRLSRILNRTMSIFAMYQYNDLVFSNPVCSAGATNCGRSSNRNVVGIGLDWQPQAIRLD